MASSMECRIQFSSLKGFPPIEEEKIETLQFINAAKEVVSVIGEY